MSAEELTRDPSAPVAPRTDRSGALSLAKVRSAYERWAPVYDEVFGACFRSGQRRAVETLASGPGERILEVGIGTGLTLPLWHRQSEVTGIDVSEPMLHRARRVRRSRGLSNVKLRLLDAQATDYADNHFDKIAALYVLSVAPSAPALLKEMRRICKPSGRIVIVNHFAHPHPFIHRCERLLANYAGLLGFHPAMPLSVITRAPGLRIHRIEPVNWGGYWTLIEAENLK
jgi:phosphatidylethanolamine/phosphatidyl-N-methylethanolamine N-methyltransferase